MIRPLILVVNLVLLAILRIFVGSPYAEIKAPQTVKAGESFLVEVAISTNGETDFMRYSMDFPQGWLVEKVETAGASFKYEKQTAKFLWSRVGETKELDISYRVTPPADASGEFTMNCKLSHTVDNLPANIPLNPMVIKVTPATGGSSEETVKHVPDSTAKPPVVISIVRTVPTEEVSEAFVVDLVVNKDDLKSFGKIEDTLPSGFTAVLVKADGADFRFENGVVKFSWFVLPAKQTLNVQYRVMVDPNVSGDQTIAGHFSYVENENGKLMAIPSSVVKIKKQEVIADNTGDHSGDKTGNNTGDTGNNTGDHSGDKTGNTGNTGDNSGSNTGNTGNTGNMADNNNGNTGNQTEKTGGAGVNYTVQIGAFQRMLPASYFTETFHVSPVNMEQSAGLNKYTTGSYTAYQSAHDNRNTIRNQGISDAFVVAYNNGKRITVQEALMITSQKWIQ
jgi:hypothetical protein